MFGFPCKKDVVLVRDMTVPWAELCLLWLNRERLMEQPGKLSAVVACVGGAMRLFIPSRGLSRHVYYAAIGIGIAMTMNRTERKDVDRITSMVAFVMDNPAYAGALDFGEKLFGEYSKGMEPDPGFRVAKFVQLIDDGDWRRFC